MHFAHALFGWFAVPHYCSVGWSRLVGRGEGGRKVVRGLGYNSLRRFSTHESLLVHQMGSEEKGWQRASQRELFYNVFLFLLGEGEEEKRGGGKEPGERRKKEK